MTARPNRIKVAGVNIKKPKTLDEALGLDRYLARIQDELSRDSIALLFDYLDRDSYLVHSGALIKVVRKEGRSKASGIG